MLNTDAIAGQASRDTPGHDAATWAAIMQGRINAKVDTLRRLAGVKGGEPIPVRLYDAGETGRGGLRKKCGHPGRPVTSDKGDRFASAQAASLAMRLNADAVRQAIAAGHRCAGRVWRFI